MKISPLRVCSIAIFLCHPVFAAQNPDVQAQSTPRNFVNARFVSPEECGSGSPGQSLQTRPAAGELVRITAGRQEKIGSRYQLRGNVEMTYRDMQLVADEADYDEDTQEVSARGRVHFTRQVLNEDVYAESARYNLEKETGQFFQVRGTTGARFSGKNVLLTTTNPLFFEAPRVDKIGENTYVVHHGYITSCRVPYPLWTLRSRSTTVRPGQSASLHDAWFRFKKVPIFYFPYFRHSLERIPRSSGFLTPHLGTSSRKGTVAGDSFYWAISRSADALLGAEYYSRRGWAQHGLLRLRPAPSSYFDVSYFGVLDRGLLQGTERLDQGGRSVAATGTRDLPHGFRAVMNINYLSSLTFRQAFTETYNEAISTEVHSIAFLSNNFDSYRFNLSLSRYQNFQSTLRHDSIEIRALPTVEFGSAGRRLSSRLPFWFSFDTAAGAVSRSEPSLKTPTFVDRFDFFPRLSMPLEWKDVHLVPSLGFRTTYYGNSLQTGPVRALSGHDLTRVTEEASLDLRPPALARVFPSPWKLLGDRWKHVIEPRASFHYANGVADFQETLRFDERDIRVNTQEIEYSLANRLYSKREKDGRVTEVASWEVTQRYFFDPTFGGALVPGRRNVFSSTVELTGYAFLDRPRHFSPITSLIRLKPSWNFDTDLRMDYDPDRHRLINTGLTANLRHGLIFTSLSQFYVRSDPLLASPSNQLRGTMGYGRLNRRGANVVFNWVYDVRNAFIQYSTTEASYNLDCCGFAIEWRRFAVGQARNENLWRIAISFANLGTFGNLKKQERLF